MVFTIIVIAPLFCLVQSSHKALLFPKNRVVAYTYSLFIPDPLAEDHDIYADGSCPR